MKKIYFLLIVLFTLFSCGGLKDAGKVLKNEKVRTTDEFLVKKKNPLQLPPNFDEVPEPDTISNNEKNDTEEIKKILKVPSEKKNKKQGSSSIEKSILREIQK
tara:strand:+ start:765 stop:1073 length:309 start_codon:yes stop_codon:yes gene_type:complete